MTEGKRGAKVGTGMKPRAGKAVVEELSLSTAADETAGENEAFEGDSEALSAEESEGSLAAVTDEVILEVATFSEAPKGVASSEHFSVLEAMMRDSSGPGVIPEKPIISIATGAEVAEFLRSGTLGLAPVDEGVQANGEYRSTVLIPEGYIEGIKDAAEAESQSLEQWLSLRLGEYLESYFYGRR